MHRSWPDFLGIGAQKAGTTWLYFALAHHPEIFMPDCKEVHFWDQHYANGYDWYEGLFQHSAYGLVNPAPLVSRSGSDSSRRLVSRNGSDKRISGEITPAYGILPSDTIAEIAQRYPDLRLIYMVREPVARAWSAACMDARNAGLAFESTPDGWFLEHFRSHGSTARGNYTACLQNWLQHFAKEQLLVLDYTCIRTHPRSMLHAVAEHLGIDVDFFRVLDEKHLVRPRNEGKGHSLRDSLRPPLEAMYAGKYDAFRAYVKKEKLNFFTS